MNTNNNLIKEKENKSMKNSIKSFNEKENKTMKKTYKSLISMLLVAFILITTTVNSFATESNDCITTGFSDSYTVKSDKEHTDRYGTYYYSSQVEYNKILTRVEMYRLYKCTQKGIVYTFVTDSTKHTKGKSDVAVKGIKISSCIKENFSSTTSFNASIGCNVSSEEISMSAKYGVGCSATNSMCSSVTKNLTLQISKNDKTGYYALRVRVPSYKVMKVTITGNYWNLKANADKSYFYMPYKTPILETVYSSNGVSNWKVL